MDKPLATIEVIKGNPHSSFPYDHTDRIRIIYWIEENGQRLINDVIEGTPGQIDRIITKKKERDLFSKEDLKKLKDELALSKKKLSVIPRDVKYNIYFGGHFVQSFYDKPGKTREELLAKIVICEDGK